MRYVKAHVATIFSAKLLLAYGEASEPNQANQQEVVSV